MRLIAALLLCGVAFAGALQAPEQVGAADGQVLVFPVHLLAEGTLQVQVPSGLELLGVVTPEPGLALVSLLVQQETLAGTYVLHLRLVQGGALLAAQTVGVMVRFHPGIRLQGPGTLTAVAGEPLTIPLSLQNTGNGADTFALSALSSAASTLSPSRLSLSPGASAQVMLQLTPQGSGAQTVVVQAASARDPHYARLIGINLEVLPFAGANLNRSFLAYQIPLSLTVGSVPLAYSLGLGLSGSLSALVSTSDTLSFSRQQNLAQEAASLSFLSPSFGLTYSASSQSGELLQLALGALTLVGSEQQGIYGAGVSYTDGPWYLAYLHRFSAPPQDELSASYTLSLGPVQIVPQLGVTGTLEGAHYPVVPTFGLGLGYQNTLLLANLEASDTSAGAWQAHLNLDSVETRPLSWALALQAQPGSAEAQVQLQETPSQEWSFLQELTLAPQSQLLLGLQYLPLSLPFNLSATLQASEQLGAPTTFGLQGTLQSLYLFNPWYVGAGLVGGILADQVPPQLQLQGGYAAASVSLGLAASVPLSPASALQLGISGQYAPGNLLLGASYSYDFGLRASSYSASLGYTLANLPGAPGILASAGYLPQQGYTWQLQGTLTLQGGLMVPTPIANLFGGENLGYLEGTLEAVGSRGTRPVAGIQVLASGTVGGEAKTDAQGWFRLTLPPGTYSLSFPNLPLSLAPLDVPVVRIERGQVASLVVRLKPSYALLGEVFLDPHRLGRPQPGDQPLPYVQVHLQGEGFDEVAQTDGNGNFLFRDLKAGTYSLSLVASSLPQGETPTTPPQEVDLKAGQAPLILLGAGPVPSKTIQTLSQNSLSLLAHLGAASAPPGALVRVEAQVGGPVQQVEARIGEGAPVALQALGKGAYRGWIQVPQAAGPVLVVTVEALGQGASAQQTLLLLVQPGPLASITLSPAVTFPGSLVQVQVHLLFQPKGPPLLHLGSQLIPLQEVGDRRYTGVFSTPEAAGTYTLHLTVGSAEVAKASLEVSLH
jgi:hypothetical protein